MRKGRQMPIALGLVLFLLSLTAAVLILFNHTAATVFERILVVLFELLMLGIAVFSFRDMRKLRYNKREKGEGRIYY